MQRISLRALVAVPSATAAVLAMAAALIPASASASHAQESMFQDDDHLIYASTATVSNTLDIIASLGVQRIRVTIQWNDVAPDSKSTTEPAGFDATNPNDYTLSQYGGSTNIWAPYDRIIEMAAAHGIGVDFNVTAPGPLWAMQPAPLTSAYGTRPTDHYEPSAIDFGEFVQALGTRYSGSYTPPAPPSAAPPSAPPILTLPIIGPLQTTTTPSETTSALPRVDYWSIWNEPNQPGWLAPQWGSVGRAAVPQSPRMYRALLDAGVGGLDVTGHTLSSDTILVGETAPEGDVSSVGTGRHLHYVNGTGFYDAMAPMVFVRALYCVNGGDRRLTGTAAANLGCPTSGSARSFINANPGLFYATGYAHHPYFFLFSPTYSSPVSNFVPLSDIGRLERGLDRIFSAYGVHRHLPIYFTEYGYQTKPPDPYQVVSPAKQAVYINEADYLAWKNSRVRSVSQFLLYDAAPDGAFPSSSYNYWDTFQTGLMYGPGTSLNGHVKPAYSAYRLPIWIPTANVRRGASTLVWGLLRMAPKNSTQSALIQWKSTSRRARYRTLASVKVPPSASGYFTAKVKPPGTGSMRIIWRSSAGHTYGSRLAAVTVGASKRASTNGATPLRSG